MVKEGSSFPPFKLQDDLGNWVSLSDFKGKKVVLYVYPKDNTPGCTQEACDFRDQWARIQKAGAIVVGLSKDSTASKKKFKEKYRLPFTLLADPDQAFLEKLGVIKDKTMYGKKVKGIVRTTFILDEQGKVVKIFPNVKVAGHVNEVLAALA